MYNLLRCLRWVGYPACNTTGAAEERLPKNCFRSLDHCIPHQATRGCKRPAASAPSRGPSCKKVIGEKRIEKHVCCLLVSARERSLQNECQIRRPQIEESRQGQPAQLERPATIREKHSAELVAHRRDGSGVEVGLSAYASARGNEFLS
jgi:hypothetical protein